MASTIGKAIMTVVPKLDSGADSKIESELSGIDAGGAGTQIGANLGKNILKAFAAIGVATKIADTIRQSVESFAEYEQLVGGVETLFKGSADVVRQYAADAFKTAGLSANQYMETVTSFSASLLQSLGEDAAAAAEYANMAVTDMSDNANKMGTDMEAIQNAYQGFAKQNFTMLDNLKLGYGGTKEEMQRLLEDAQKLSGIEYDVSSYADIVDAIHVIQSEMDISGYSVDQLNEKLSSMSLTTEELQKVADDMGIRFEEAYARMVDGTLSASDAQILLGTTAKEAASTVQGSINSMKGAWENWLTALGGGGDVEKATQDLVDSVATTLENLIPVIGTILNKVVESLPGLAMQLAPVLLESIWNLGNSIFDTIGEILAQVLIAVSVGTYNVLSTIVGFLASLWDCLVSTASSIWSDVSAAFSSGVESSVSFVASLPGRVLSIFAGVGTWLIESGRSLIQGFVDGIMGAIDWAAGCVSDALTAIRDLFPFSPAKEGPFSGKGWTLYSGMAIAESLGEGFDRRIGDTVSRVKRSLGSLREVLDVRSSGGVGGNVTNIYIDGARINDDAAMEESTYRFLMRLNHIATTEGAA